MVSKLTVYVDGVVVAVDDGTTILDACDQAGTYVPRLCYFPGLPPASETLRAEEPGENITECGLCVVRLGDGRVARACTTLVTPDLRVTTDDPGLRAMRQDRLAAIMGDHPHVCLTCADRHGCARDQCAYGNPPEARCCDLAGHCELGRLFAFVMGEYGVPLGDGPYDRRTIREGPINREPGLCVGCGRCVRVCEISPGAGRALELVQVRSDSDRLWAQPKKETLRASGCTFCGRCIMVCPAGALSASSQAGVQWLQGRSERSGLGRPVLPPEARLSVKEAREWATSEPGVIRLLDRVGVDVYIVGVADLAQGLERAMVQQGAEEACYVSLEPAALYTQRESELLGEYVRRHGHLPACNDPGDDLFDDLDDAGVDDWDEPA